MFGSSKKVEDVKTSTPATGGGTNPNALNTLVKGTVVEGTIRSDSDIRIDGTVKGKLNCAAKVIIGPTGNVDGEIKCQNAVIEGKFTGNIFVSELLNVRETAEINGDVHTHKLTVQSGSVFNVAVHMTDQPAANGSTGGQNSMKNVSTAAVAGGAEKAKN